MERPRGVASRRRRCGGARTGAARRARSRRRRRADRPRGLPANCARAEALELAGPPAEALEPRADAPSRRRAASRTACAPRRSSRASASSREDPREAARVLALAAEAASTPGRERRSGDRPDPPRASRGTTAAAGASAARAIFCSRRRRTTRAATPAFARRRGGRGRGDADAGRSRPARAARSSRPATRGAAWRLLSQDRAAAWPEGERGANLLALARGQLALKKTKAAEARRRAFPTTERSPPTRRGSSAATSSSARLRGKDAGNASSAGDPRLEPVRRALEALTGRRFRPRSGAARRSACCASRRTPSDFDDGPRCWRARSTDEDPRRPRGLRAAVAAVLETVPRPATTPVARARFEALPASTATSRVAAARVLAGALPRGRGATRGGERGLRRSSPRADAARPLRPIRARARPAAPRRVEPRALGIPSTATAAFARVDELLRLRMFEEASAEARMLRPRAAGTCGIAQADFALGRFLTAAAAIKRALPEIGTAEEGRVPDALAPALLPDRGGRIPRRSAPGSSPSTPAVLRGLVRQESVFDAQREVARRRDGAHAADAGDREEPVALGPALALPPRVSLRPGRERARSAPRTCESSSTSSTARRSSALAAYNGGPTASRGRSREPGAAGGRALRVDSALRDARLRAPGAAVRRVVSGAVPVSESQVSSPGPRSRPS